MKKSGSDFEGKSGDIFSRWREKRPVPDDGIAWKIHGYTPTSWICFNLEEPYYYDNDLAVC